MSRKQEKKEHEARAGSSVPEHSPERATASSEEADPTAGGRVPGTVDEVCRNCLCRQSEHRLVNYADGPHVGAAVLICPDKTFDPRRWYDK